MSNDPAIMDGMASPRAEPKVEPADIRRALEHAEKPLSSVGLSKLLQQKKSKAFKPTLDAEVHAGRIHRWGSNLYWDRNPSVLARERLLKLTSSEVLSAAPLAKRAAEESPKIGLPLVRTVRKELLLEKLLREVSKAKLNVNVEHPEPYLEQEIGRLLADFGLERSKERIRGLLDAAQPPPQPVPESGVPEVAEKIFAAMNRIASGSATFYALRQEPELAFVPKPLFDKAALLLQQERKALLAVHDHGSRLPKDEQDKLVTDGLGTYYVSIYAL